VGVFKQHQKHQIPHHNQKKARTRLRRPWWLVEWLESSDPMVVTTQGAREVAKGERE